MEDEAEIYDGIREEFPLTFGKQSKTQTSLEAIHKTTLRTTPASASADDANTSKTSSSKGFPSLSSSSQSWLDSVRTSKKNSKNNAPKPCTIVGPARDPRAEERLNDDEEEMIGPPRPKEGVVEEEDEEEMIGKLEGIIEAEEEDEEEYIGPPRPPPSMEGVSGASTDEEFEDEEEEKHRIPLSNEIVLKGHTKRRARLQFPRNEFSLAIH